MERISDDVYREGSTALITLNRLADGSLAARPGASQLDRLAGRLKIAVTRLRRLRPPEPARASDYDLECAVASYSLDLRFAATDVRVAAREQADLGTIARGQARTVRVHQSGVSALSRALRRLAFQPSEPRVQLPRQSGSKSLPE